MNENNQNNLAVDQTALLEGGAEAGGLSLVQTEAEVGKEILTQEAEVSH